MNYDKIVTGQLDVNTYIIPNDNGDCLIIDPSDHCDKVIAHLRKKNLTPRAILLTHGHFDHIMGVTEIAAAYPGVEVYIHDDDRERLSSPARNGSVYFGQSFAYTGSISSLADGIMRVGEFEFRVLHVPGHTQGGCAFVFGDGDDAVCFSGDTIFANSVGRTDLPGGNSAQLITSIRKKILTLPPKTVLCPGHGGRTSVEREARLNPYL